MISKTLPLSLNYKLLSMVKCTLHSGETVLINTKNINYCGEGNLPHYGDVKLVKVVFVDGTDKWLRHSLSELVDLFTVVSS